jgi:hypothetical protein
LSKRPVRFRRRIADTDSEFMERSKDVGVTAQKTSDEDSEQQYDENHDHKQGNHSDSFSTVRPSIQPRGSL